MLGPQTLSSAPYKGRDTLSQQRCLDPLSPSSHHILQFGG